MLLRQWQAGDRQALDRLIPLVYNELHVIFENAGHVPPRIDVVREVLDWLD